MEKSILTYLLKERVTKDGPYCDLYKINRRKGN